VNWINTKDQSAPMDEIILVTDKENKVCLIKIEQWDLRKHFMSVGISGYDWQMDIDRIEDIELWCKVELPTKEK
jgi:hypothetical protein